MGEGRESSPAPYRTAGLAAAIAWCVYAATTGGSFATDLASYEVTASLVEDGSVAMRYDVLDTEHERNVDGRYYAPVGIGHPVFGVPFYAAAKLLMATGFRPGKSETLTKAAVVFGSTFAAAGCVFFGFLLVWRLWGDRKAAAGASLLLGFATPLWVYAKFGFNAPLAAMCLSAAAFGFTTGTRTRSIDWLFGGGAALGYAVLTRHEMLLGAVPGAVWIWMESRAAPRDRVSWFASAGAPVLVAVIIWLAYNYGRFGNPLDTGLLHDPNVRFDTPFFVGLHGLLLSPGRSLLLYAPLSLAGLLALWRSRREAPSATVFFSLHLLVFLLLVAKMHQWDGGESYGPRYLVPILPFFTLPVARWLGRTSNPVSRRAVLALAAVAIAVQLPGVLVDFSKAQLAFARSRPDYSIALTRYTWAGAPLVLNARTAMTAVPENVGYLTGHRTAPDAPVTSDESDRGFSQQFAFSLDFWWLYLFYMGALPRWVALLAPLILLGTAWGLSRRLRRQVDPPART